MSDSFHARTTLQVGQKKYEIFSLKIAAEQEKKIARLPYSLKILLENLLRREDGIHVKREDVETLLKWNPKASTTSEISYLPARVVLQDFTGVPAFVDLAGMRDAMTKLDGEANRISPMIPAHLVIDHSVQVDFFGTDRAFEKNKEMDYSRNSERYAFLRWGQQAFENFKVVPPNSGIVHQVNLEYLSQVVFVENNDSTLRAYPDTCIGTDSHTPMVNGLGVLAWGVGGIEAEAALLGQPISMVIPEVVGVELEGSLSEGVTATDLVLTITEMLRKEGVVGKFVEFFGSGVRELSIADRATIGNMSPEYGATCALFPPDQVTLDYLKFTGRNEEQIALVEAYTKEQGLFYDETSPAPSFSSVLQLNLKKIDPCIAGPRRPQDRVALEKAGQAFLNELPNLTTAAKEKLKKSSDAKVKSVITKSDAQVKDGSVVIAAITSCTNTSNPSVMIAAGLLAKKAVEKGLKTQKWVKTSLAPGSKVVTDYFQTSGLDRYLDDLGFNLAAYGCTTCIGNSGPLPEEISQQVQDQNLVVVAVLSGNRNFEGRINPDVRANYLMSPPLVVAYALKGDMTWNPLKEPVGKDRDNKDVFLKDLWPTNQEIQDQVKACVQSDMYKKVYSKIFNGDEKWNSMAIPQGQIYDWNKDSSYIRKPPFFDGLKKDVPEIPEDIHGARAILLLGDSVTTDHISPAGNIKKDSPAGSYLVELGVEPKDFNSYGSRRGNHEVMVRGTFANTRIRNQLAPETEGGFTTYLPKNKVMTVFEAAELYRKDKTPLCVIAGKEYGSGSSRDWAAKGPLLLGIRFVLAESFERIHRSNLVGMGILPLQFKKGENAKSLRLTGTEIFDIQGLKDALTEQFKNGKEITISAKLEGGGDKNFQVLVRIDTPQEMAYFIHGGILPFVLRLLLNGKDKMKVTSGGLSTAHGGLTFPDRLVHAAGDESFPASDSPAY
jgi:aconitate hydratase